MVSANILIRSLFNALLIGSGLVAAVGLCMKRGIFIEELNINIRNMPFVFNPDNSRANDEDEGNDNLAPSLQNILNSNKQLKTAVQARDLDYKRI